MLPSAPESLPTRLRLTVRPGLSELEPARLAVHAFLAGRVPSARALYRLDLVLEESLMNRMWHAHPLGESKDTQVQVDLSTEALQVRFEDEGTPFDPTLEDWSPGPADLLAAQSGGRGLLLTRKAARQWSYERAGGTNVFTVVLALD